MMYVSTTLASLALALSVAASSDAADAQSSGIIHHGKETMDALQSTGRVTLDGTTIQDRLKITGSLFAQNASIGKLQVDGHAHLVGSKVSGKSNISGFFNAENCTFGSDLCVKAHKITLKKCTAESIEMKKVMWPFDTQIVELLEGSVCNGNITFESGKGRVLLRDGSMLNGKVVDGEVDKK